MAFETVVAWFQSLSIFSWILWSIVISEFLRRLCSKIYYDHIYCQPPGPAGLPLIGSLIPIVNSPKSFFKKTAEQYGPIMSINMGLQRNIFINDKKVYKKLCSQNKAIGVDKPHFNYLELVLKELSLDLVNGKRWELRRKLVSSSFFTLVHSKFVSKTIDSSMKNITDDLDKKSDNIWYPRADLKYIVFNVAFKALFGAELNRDHKLLPRFFEKNTDLFTGFMPLIFFDMFRINFIPNWLIKRTILSKVTQTLHDLEGLIEDWMVTEGGFKIDKENEMIQRSTEQMTDNGSYYIDTVIEYLRSNKDICYETLMLDFNTILMAAADTTAHSLEYGLCLLCKHQNIQQIIYEELSTVLEKHKMDKFDISLITECVNLRAFVFETLRISNVVPLNPHFNSDKDIHVKCENKSYFIPKNTAIYINALYIHYGGVGNGSFEINFKNWIDGNGKFKMNSEFILFGIGKRNCVGQTLAMRELYYVFATLILRYTLEVKDKNELAKLSEMKQAWNAVTTLYPEIGMNLTKRK